MRPFLPPAFGLALLLAATVAAADWPMGGRDNTRNPVSPELRPPTDWRVGSEDHRPRNIKWAARAGSRGLGGPVVANGLVWVGTNNDAELDPAVKGDHGVLACFRESDGKFLYQHASLRLKLKVEHNFVHDWPESGLGCAPIAEGDRLWFVTNRREVVCLDTGPLRRGDGPPKVLWSCDLVRDHGVFPRSPMIPSHTNVGCPAVYKDLLFVPTGNGYDASNTRMPNPKAPALVCLRKDTGRVVWTDNSAGTELCSGHHASPLVVEVAGRAQVIHAQADGWLRAYDAATGKPVWRFDVNDKDARRGTIGEAIGKRKLAVVATPVYAEGKVYFAVGQEPEGCDREGRLFCIDPAKAGDISPQVDGGDAKRKPNPNSGLVWERSRFGEGKDQVIAQSTSSVAVDAGLVVCVDRWGGVHCIDAKTGGHHWTHLVSGGLFGDPLVADGKVYVGDDDGIITILELSKVKKVVTKRDMGNGVCASPAYANRTLFVLTNRKLFAIQEPDGGPKK